MKERRQAKRISTNLTARWSTPGNSHEGKIIDLSTGGCFILTAKSMPANKLSLVTQVSKEEPIQVELQLPNVESLAVKAEVVYRIERVGFAARFRNLALQDEQALCAFIDEQEPG